VLREVATLSRLQHQHVVRYYQVIIRAHVFFLLRSYNVIQFYLLPASLTCQAWVETEYGHHHVLNTGASRTADSSLYSFDDISLSDSGAGNKQESTYLYIQMEYCPRYVLIHYASGKDL
jgi:translation initiation factor 2-alpha kinase 4